jgi:hypothetical protein
MNIKKNNLDLITNKKKNDIKIKKNINLIINKLKIT